MTVQLAPSHPDFGKRRNITPKLRAAVIERDERVCRICDLPIQDDDELHIDHIVPVCAGGTNHIDNLRATHSRCNLERGTGGHKPLNPRRIQRKSVEEQVEAYIFGAIEKELAAKGESSTHIELEGSGVMYCTPKQALEYCTAKQVAEERERREEAREEADARYRETLRLYEEMGYLKGYKAALEELGAQPIRKRWWQR